MSVVIGNEPEEGDEKKKSSLVEDARAAVRAARRKQLEEIRAARRKAVKAEQDWDDYQDILFCNLPTRLAQREGVTSFSPAMQTVFIDKADMELRQQRLSQRLKTTEADPALQKVMKLQNTQGFWELTPGLVDAVGGMFPDTPPGIVDWRWATACALAFLRRRPDQHSFLQHVHDKGVDWVQPPWLLKAARERLPPDNCYFDLDEMAVREGRWRDSEGLNFRTLGYEAFVRHPREELQDASLTTDSTTASEWVERQQEEQQKNASGEPSKIGAKKGGVVTDPRRLAKHMDSLARDFNLHTKREPGKKAELGRDIERLRDAWSQPLPLRSERARLEKSRAAPREATPWNNDTAMLPPVGRGRRHRQRLDPKINKDTSMLSSRSIDTPALSHMREPSNESRDLLTDTTLGSTTGSMTEDSLDDARKELQKAQLQVVDAITEYDRYRKEISTVATKCSKAYRNARLHIQRQDAFDELSEMLGPYRWARAGFEDWRGRPVKGIQNITIKLVEAVVRWREAMASVGRPTAPFLWENRNVILSLATGLDFLAEFPELVEWYSVEYNFKRNPFSRACVLDERPKTPPSPMIKVQIDGKTVEQLNERLLLKTQAAQKIVDKWDKKMKNAPSWWPDQGEPGHQQRMRAAEKVILKEESIYGQAGQISSPLE